MKNKDNPFSFKKANDASGFLLWQVHNLWQREIKRKLKLHNLTHTQFVILASTYWLVLQGEQVNQKRIANHAHADVMMTSSVLRKLEEKGLVTRKGHKIDTRAKVISVTDKGQEVLTKAIKVVEDFDRQFFGKIDGIKKFNANLLNLIEK